MRLTKFTLNVLIALLVSLGLVCAQLCDIGCALQAHPTTATHDAQGGSDSHCHQKKKPETPRPQPPDHSGCAAHAQVTALPNSAPDFAAAGEQHIAPAFVTVWWAQNDALEQIRGSANYRLPLRSPPLSSRSVVLRV